MSKYTLAALLSARLVACRSDRYCTLEPVSSLPDKTAALPSVGNLIGSTAVVSSATVVVSEVVSAVSDKTTAEALVEKCRALYLKMQFPSTEYNAYSKMSGSEKTVTTWTDADRIVVLLKASVMAEIDVEVLASAFNMDKADLLGRIISVDNFDQYDDEGNKIFDGSAILGFVGDSSWFRIKRQDMYLDEFYNANNRTWQYYLNLTKMYNYSLFANGVVLATSAPSVDIVSMKFADETGLSVKAGEKLELHVETTPFPATATITYTSSATGKGTVAAKEGNNKIAVVTGVAAGSTTITATAGNVTATYSVTVEAAE